MKESYKQYILYVGNFYYHKNLQRLRVAFKKLVLEDGFKNYKLILVGGKPYQENDCIISTGYLDDNALNNFYRGADLYVLPSLYEGFGFTALEAMKRGVPVVSSSTSCLPEILGDAAIYFNPLDIRDMVAKIKTVLLNRDLKRDLIKKGLQRAKLYPWEKTAKQTLNYYEQI